MEKKENKIFELATFYVGDTLCGIDILKIQEINKQIEVTRVPQSPVYVKGVLNLRGRIVTVIDLGEKLELTPIKSGKESRNIIVNYNDEQIGFLIDKISDVLIAESEKIEAAPANIGGIQGKYFDGIYKTEKNLIGILNVDAVLRN